MLCMVLLCTCKHIVNMLCQWSGMIVNFVYSAEQSHMQIKFKDRCISTSILPRLHLYCLDTGRCPLLLLHFLTSANLHTVAAVWLPSWPFNGNCHPPRYFRTPYGCWPRRLRSTHPPRSFSGVRYCRSRYSHRTTADWFWYRWLCSKVVPIIYARPHTVCSSRCSMLFGRSPALWCSTGLGAWANCIHTVHRRPGNTCSQIQLVTPPLRWWHPCRKWPSGPFTLNPPLMYRMLKIS